MTRFVHQDEKKVTNTLPWWMTISWLEKSAKVWGTTGIEPMTSCTRSRHYTSKLSPLLSNKRIVNIYIYVLHTLVGNLSLAGQGQQDFKHSKLQRKMVYSKRPKSNSLLSSLASCWFTVFPCSCACLHVTDPLPLCRAIKCPLKSWLFLFGSP